MTPRSEYDAAYFTMLRAVEERDDLLRYRDFLEHERERLDEFAAASRDAGKDLPRRIRRSVDQTGRALLEVIARRRAVLVDDLGRMDDRIAAAEAFVAECETEVAGLRR